MPKVSRAAAARNSAAGAERSPTNRSMMSEVPPLARTTYLRPYLPPPDLAVLATGPGSIAWTPQSSIDST
jgi:hypothetical protein